MFYFYFYFYFKNRPGLALQFIYIIGPRPYFETHLDDPVPFLEHLSVSDREPHRVQIEKVASTNLNRAR